jgi:hypothetical protein
LRIRCPVAGAGLAALALVAFDRAPAYPQPSDDLRDGIVRGLVVDSSGRPVEGAAVSVFWQGPDGRTLSAQAPRSNTQGAFEIGGLPSRLGTVMASHPDFAPAIYPVLGWSWPTRPLNVRLVLTGGALVEGVALQKHGTPLAGLNVEVRLSEGSLAPPFRTRTLADGSFAIAHVPADSRPTVHLTDTDGQHVGLWGRIPGDRIQDGDAVKVRFEGSVVRMRVRLLREGRPLERIIVRPMDRPHVTSPPPTREQRARSRGDILTGDDGRFDLFLPPGAYGYVFESREGRRQYGYRRIEVPDADDPQVEIAIGHSVTVSGRVVEKDTGKGIPGAVLNVRHAAGPAADRLTRWTEDDGHFLIDLETGDYFVRAEAWAHEPSDVAVAAYGAGLDLRLELGRGLQIAGRVLGCDDNSYCTVNVVPQDGSEQHSFGLVDGRFRTGTLSAKLYNLCVGSDRVGWAVRAGVEPGRESLAMTVQPPGRVELHVTDPDGRPLVGASAVVRSVAGARVQVPFLGTSLAFADRAGRVRMLVPAGAVEIALLAQRVKGLAKVEVGSGETVSQRVVLSEPSGLLP